MEIRLRFQRVQQQRLILVPFGRFFDLASRFVIERIAPISGNEHFSNAEVLSLLLPGIDYDRQMLLNLGDESFVSYTKGCFLGQEIVARVKHRGKPPKKLVVLELDPTDPRASDLTSKIPTSVGKMKGFLFVDNI